MKEETKSINILTWAKAYGECWCSLINFCYQENIKGWLKKHHLEQYHSEFAEVFEHPCQLLKLKNEPEKDFKESARKKFGIEKPGHFKRLLKAVYSLQVKGKQSLNHCNLVLL